MTARAARVEGPGPRTRRAVSLCIALHFFAILTTLVGTGNYRFPAPMLAVWLRHMKPVDMYLQSTFLTSPFRFFAPDPGPTNLLWFELMYADGSSRWVEVARRDEFASRISFERHMSLGAFIAWTALVPTNDPRRSVITEEGRVCTSSLVRHVADSHPLVDVDGAPVPIRAVNVYIVRHHVLEPYQVRLGFQPDDLRLYTQAYLGIYSPAGVRGDDAFAPDAVEVPFNSYLFAEFLLEHAANTLRGVPAAARLGKLASFHLPSAWEHVLTLHPGLLDGIPEAFASDGGALAPDAVERLQRRIEEAIMSGDTARAPQTKPGDR